MMNINHLIFLNRENQRAIRAFLTLTFLCSTTSPFHLQCISLIFLEKVNNLGILLVFLKTVILLNSMVFLKKDLMYSMAD